MNKSLLLTGLSPGQILALHRANTTSSKNILAHVAHVGRITSQIEMFSGSHLKVK